MVKILHVVSSLNINAGMMSVIMNYYRRIDRTQILFDFLCLAETRSTHEEEILSYGGKTYFLGNASFNKDYRQKLKDFFEEHKGEYAAVHCHPIWSAALVGNIAKKSGVEHVISHSHSTKFSEKRISAIRNRLMMPIIRKSSTDFAACSKDASKLFSTNKKVFILHNAIDIKKYKYEAEKREKIRDEFSIGKDEILIGHVGRFSPEKNHEFMLRAFAKVKESLPNAKLIFVGDGFLRKSMEALSKELSVDDSVIFTGKRYDIPDILSAMDVFWLPSLFEGVPLSIIEAQASGLPCVISKTITRDVDLGFCVYANIENESKWANITCDIAKTEIDRVKNGKKLSGGIYDIESETENLFKFYLKFSD